MKLLRPISQTSPTFRGMLTSVRHVLPCQASRATTRRQGTLFRRTKHYALAAPMECLLSKGQRFFAGKVVNLSLHGAFVSQTVVQLDSGDVIGMNLRLLRPGVEISVLEGQARVVWRNIGAVSNLPTGLGLEFLHDDQTLRDCVAMISEFRRRHVVKYDERQRLTTLAPATSS